MTKHAHAHAHLGDRDIHGNPKDLKAYRKRLDSPERAQWQHPARLLRALKLRPGQVACDIGSGTGYFAVPMARRVGPRGVVYAVDVEPALLSLMREKARALRAKNVVPVLGAADDPLIPRGSCDLILMVNVFHHIRDVAYLRRLSQCLKRDGRVVNVDFHDVETPVGPPVKERLPEEAFLRLAKRAGLAVEREERWLPYQYFHVLRPT